MMIISNMYDIRQLQSGVPTRVDQKEGEGKGKERKEMHIFEVSKMKKQEEEYLKEVLYL